MSILKVVAAIVSVGLGVACSTQHNPASCCTSTLQCASFGLNEMHGCDGLLVCSADGACTAPDCETSDDCNDPNLPLCSGQLCVATCSDDSQCNAGTPHCAPTGACVECTESTQCPSTAPVCDQNVCITPPPAPVCVQRILGFDGDGFGGQLYQIGLDDLVQQPLFDRTSSSSAAYSPDGKKIALVRSVDGIENTLWVVDADGQNSMQLDSYDTNATSLGVFGVAWSPDGAKIAYGVQKIGDPTTSNIWVTDLAGNKSNITTGVQAQGPSWSPDGTQILFTSTRTGNLDVFTMKPDGSSQHNLTNRATNDDDPHWSPDGNKIVYTYATASSNTQIWAMNGDASTNQALTVPVSSYDGSPRWISNQQIVFVHNYMNGSASQLYVTSPTGTNQHVFAASQNTLGQTAPLASRDGKILGWSESDGNQQEQLWYSDTTTIVPTRITSSGHNLVLDWQPCP